MAAQAETHPGLIEALDGSHLHWTVFREDVLQPFRIRCSPSPRKDRLPTTFLARLEASQKNLAKYHTQRQAWQLDVAAGRRLSAMAVFPPNLLPPFLDASNVLRCIVPRMSREGLPLRNPSVKDSLYELPSAKPAYVCGFDMAMFEKTEQAQLTGGLSVAGTLVDFNRGEVSSSKTICCPFLAFEKFRTTAESDIQASQNSCAITGAQCLRSQQQLFHKAFGLQTVSQPPITFTCALNDEQAVINCHYVDDNGEFTMTALCKFNLEVDDHFFMFQAWIEAIESWASLYLLPRLKGAVNQVLRSNPSPPPSPTPTTNGHLSINTNPDGGLLAIMADLHRNWPMIRWQNDAIGETPINSSIAQCGTPLNARQMQSLALPRPSSNESLSSRNDSIDQIRPHSSLSQRLSDPLTPLQTNFSLSARPRSAVRQRLFLTAGSMTSSASDGAETPYSPCRPATLSPCTPGPEAPVSSKSPMLVLQRRLDLAMDEIQGLRIQADDLQAQLNGRTEILERRLELVVERQETRTSTVDAIKEKTMGGGWIKQLEALAEEELKTPIAQSPVRVAEEHIEHCLQFATPKPAMMQIPGQFPVTAQQDLESWGSSWLTEDFVIWCLAVILKDARASLTATTLGALFLCYLGNLDTAGTCTNLVLVFVLDSHVKNVLWHIWHRLCMLYDAAQAYDLRNTDKVIVDAPDTTIKEREEADVPILLA